MASIERPVHRECLCMIVNLDDLAPTRRVERRLLKNLAVVNQSITQCYSQQAAGRRSGHHEPMD
jgi:hypothetical protein